MASFLVLFLIALSEGRRYGWHSQMIVTLFCLAGVFLVAFVATPGFVFATVAGLRGADPAARELLRSVDASRLEVLTQALLDEGLPEDAIRAVMGENALRFLLANLP